MTQFERAIQAPIACDICGAVMHPMYGGGWDNDRILCANRECGAEIVYPTSTEQPNKQLHIIEPSTGDPFSEQRH